MNKWVKVNWRGREERNKGVMIPISLSGIKNCDFSLWGKTLQTISFPALFLPYLSSVPHSCLGSSQTHHCSTEEVDPTLLKLPIPKQRSRITGTFPLLTIATGLELLKRFTILILLVGQILHALHPSWTLALLALKLICTVRGTGRRVFIDVREQLNWPAAKDLILGHQMRANWIQLF